MEDHKNFGNISANQSLFGLFSSNVATCGQTQLEWIFFKFNIPWYAEQPFQERTGRLLYLQYTF